MARLCHAPSALISGRAIDAFAEQVRVPVVPGVLLDHVLEIHRSDIGFVAPGARLDELIAKLKALFAALDAAGSR